MNISHVFIQIASPDRAHLVGFYRDTVQLPAREGMGPDNFAIGADTTLGIGEHSEVSGRAKDPARVLLDLWVDDIDAEQARLEATGVRFIRNKGVEFWGGVISTFSDPDGNLIQIVQLRPELASLPEGEAAGVA